MRIKVKIPIVIVAALTWVVVISSCANLGMPTGGPKDTIPPVLIGTNPKFAALNFKGDEVRLTFNEYINTEDISEDLVISPPLAKRPTIRTKSKSLVIGFNEDLKDSTTYSLDFKNSIADNNEKNPYKNLRFSFSTGPVYDSLRIAGRVMNAFNMEPKEKGLVMLHHNLHDSAVFRLLPDYIAKTDENGIFLIDNIAPGKYHLFSINDANNNLKYDEGAEEIAFVDSIVVPSAEYVEELDTLVSGVDSFLVYGHTHFHPDPFYLRQFTEDIYDQYLKRDEREARNKCIFAFNESVKDTFSVHLLNYKPVLKNWYQLEYDENVDSLVMWIADTMVTKMDTLLMQVSYFQLDTAGQLYVQKDTLEMDFTDKTLDISKRKKRPKEEEDKPKPIEQFNWTTTLSGPKIELNQDLEIVAPEPIKSFDETMVKLYLTEDTLERPLNFSIAKDTSAWRTYNIHYKWEPETAYTLEIDSAACVNIYGITSKKFIKKFTSREDDYYGSLKMVLTNVEMPMIVQLVQNDAKEKVLYEKSIDKDGDVLFDYLAPGKLRIKVIYDKNGNGKWDTGSYQDKTEPERVAYVNEVHKVRSNFDEEITWDVKPDPTYVKKIRDVELEEKKRKEAEEKARKEQENQNKPQQMQNSIQGGGSNRFQY